jgi:hypothetical protein
MSPRRSKPDADAGVFARFLMDDDGVRYVAPAFFALLLFAGTPPAWAATLVVPTQFTTIQAAIDAAQSGDQVVVEPGTYSENLTFRSNVDVLGAETAFTFIQPQTSAQPTVLIRVASNLRFSNFTLIGAATAISVAGSTGVQITNVVFESATSIAIDSTTSSAQVTNNVFFDNALAIRRDSTLVAITNNIFRSNTATIRNNGALLDLNTNVVSNCWSNNADLLVGGVDGGYGTQITLGDPLFVAESGGDYHLKQGSPCIDVGQGTDVIDNSVADLGAYGGPYADPLPMPVTGLTLTDTSAATPAITVAWAANLSYLVTNSSLPGSYNVYYNQGTSGPPYNGTDAGGGAQPSPVNAGNVTTFALANLSPLASRASATELLSAAGVNQGVTLGWVAVPGASGYRVHYGVASTAESEKDVGNVTTFTVQGLTNGTSYVFAVGTLTQATYYVAVTARDSTPSKHESDYSAESSIAVGTAAESLLSNQLSARPQSTTPYPALPDKGGCFIATAAYGADWYADVQALRDFRDTYLLRNAPGRWFVAHYYALSPAVADYIRAHSALKPIVRALLTPLVVVALFLLGSGVAAKAGVATLLVALAGVFWRRRRRGGQRTDGVAPTC